MGETNTPPFPVIDTDPQFTRVVKYFRPFDYVSGLGIAALGPAMMYWFEKYQPSGNAGAPLRTAMRAAGGLGAIAGFLFAFQSSTFRFLGYKENAREIKKYREEYKRLTAQGKTMEGPSSLSPELQAIAARYSTNSAFNIAVLPFPNFISHPYHGQSQGILEDEEDLSDIAQKP